MITSLGEFSTDKSLAVLCFKVFIYVPGSVNRTVSAGCLTSGSCMCPVVSSGMRVRYIITTGRPCRLWNCTRYRIATVTTPIVSNGLYFNQPRHKCLANWISMVWILISWWLLLLIHGSNSLFYFILFRLYFAELHVKTLNKLICYSDKNVLVIH